jgi:hypothetical protein
LAEQADSSVARRLTPAAERALRDTLNGLMVMSPEFRYDTARLFLTMFGRSRNIRRELEADPLDLLEEQSEAARCVPALIRLLAR